MGAKVQTASASQQQPQPPSAAISESNGDTEMLAASRTDLQELLQRRGESETPGRDTLSLLLSLRGPLARRAVWQHEL